MANPPVFGSIHEFQPDSEIVSTYLERMQLFFTANSVPQEKQVPVFLSVVGAKAYALLRSLLSPQLPHTRTYEELKDALKQHFQPKPLVIAERFHFHRRNQAMGESIAEYMAELRRLTTYCEFGDYLNQALRDRFVCGLRNEGIQRRLLAEDDLTLKKALELSQGMEAAETNAKSLKAIEAPIQTVSSVDKHKTATPCYRCGKSNHSAVHCRFRDAVCHKCGKKGHIASVCKSKERPKQAKKPFQHQHHRPSIQSAKWTAVEEGKLESQDVNPDELHIYTVGHGSPKPICVELLINKKPLCMEVDTGATISIISAKQHKDLFPDAVLRKSQVILKTYTGERMQVLGEMMATVKYGDQEKSLLLTVVEGDGPALIGRNWLEHIKLDWKKIGSVVTDKNSSNQLQLILTRYAELFNDSLGTIRSFKANLQVCPDAQPKFFKPRSVPFAIKGAIEEELDRLEACGILEKVTHSEWAAPIVAVPKKDGKIRICGDYKVTINQALAVDQYPLPKPDELFATLAGGKKFSKLDLSQAYQQVVLDAESTKYVTINTHRGVYRYTRLPFGVASAPAMFQKIMDSILQGIPKVICGKDDEEHLHNLNEVFKRLQAHGVRIKRDKCHFMKESVEYLGHRIDAEGLHATEDKLEAIAKAPVPRNIQELRSFLGLLNYYRKFLPNLSTVLEPLNNLLQKDHPWEWTSQCTEAFQKAKNSLMKSKALTHYDSTLPITLAADASAYGVGAVISHIQPDGSEQPIAFASRTLSASEQNYAQIEKEALALIFGVQKFHKYLYGRKFTLITDHKPLMTILGPKKGIPSLAAARMQRWAVLLAAYDYNIQFKPSGDHGNADALSRLPLVRNSLGNSTEPSIFNINCIESLPVTSNEIRRETRKDRMLSKVLTHTKRGWPGQIPDSLKPFYMRRNELSVEEGCLLWGIRVLIPKSLQKKLLQELHNEHIGISKMKALARSHMWWPGLDNDLEMMAKSCQECQLVKQAPPQAPMHPWIWPLKPWQRVHIDFAGPFLGKMFFIAVDAHSKWPEVVEMAQVTTSKTVDILRYLFSCYGLPEQIVSDNGPQFISSEFDKFMKGNGIKHVRCSPYHPSSNGAAERFVRTFKEAMKASKHDGLTFTHRLNNFLLKYRSSPHSTTSTAPATLFLGRELRTRLDLLKPDLERSVSKKQATQKLHHDQHSKERDFFVGQKVMVRNVRPGPDWIPVLIIQQLGPLSFLVDIGDGRRWKRHVDHLKTGLLSTEFSTRDGSSYATVTRESIPESTINDPARSTTDKSSFVHRYPTRVRRPPDRLTF